MDDVEQPHGLGGLVRLQPPDPVQPDIWMSARAAQAIWSSASCTRFSPNSRWPAEISASISSACPALADGNELHPCGSRLASAAAWRFRRGSSGAVGGTTSSDGAIGSRMTRRQTRPATMAYHCHARRRQVWRMPASCRSAACSLSSAESRRRRVHRYLRDRWRICAGSALLLEGGDDGNARSRSSRELTQCAARTRRR